MKKRKKSVKKKPQSMSEYWGFDKIPGVTVKYVEHRKKKMKKKK